LKTVFMFPGQGSQEVGMGRALAERESAIGELYRRANDIVGYDLAKLCFEGPAEQLNETEFSQPAIFVTSAACLQALRDGLIGADLGGVNPDACAGLSLGEYTALYASGAMSFADGLKLVQLRGRSMQEAAEENPGAMVSILGLDEPGAQKLCQAVRAAVDEADVVIEAVNFNCPGQIVLSGTSPACVRAAELAEEYGASRAIPLKVAGAFHTKMMAAAAAKLEAGLAECRFSRPDCPVVANVDACEYDGPAEIPVKLLAQLIGPVRWQQSVEYVLGQGSERFVEIGPGRVLTGLVKKTARSLKLKPRIVTVNGVTA